MRRDGLLTSRGRGVAVIQALTQYKAEAEERDVLRGVVQGIMDLEAGRELDLSGSPTSAGAGSLHSQPISGTLACMTKTRLTTGVFP